MVSIQRPHRQRTSQLAWTIVDATSAPLGAQAATWVDLAPGVYALVCPIPEGTSDLAHEGDGLPHFLLGMLSELVVVT